MVEVLGLTDYQLSEITGSPRAKVIQIVNELEQMGLVTIETTVREELVVNWDYAEKYFGKKLDK